MGNLMRQSSINLFEELLYAVAVPLLAGDLLNYGKSHETVFYYRKTYALICN
jgi:hypothetical protein